jgi:superfamily II DNA or RNA helicase
MERMKIFAAGARVNIRDAEWIVKRVDRTSSGGQALSCVGISELVKDKECIFLTEIDQDIQILDPAKTKLVHDDSANYRNSILFMESLLRQTPPTDNKITIGHKAAMDVLPFQLEPARMALTEARQRILIADAVGLGKTMEAGILMTELIRRGRGKRILVLTLKSMMTQFQKELWSRFSIPLTRLDSVGIQRMKHKIPTNHNPFHYFDKAIISIDTLKQDGEYRTKLEQCYWDIIVIDEAHNVAERGSNSLRARLAKLLSSRSDTLIMLSATPHDGRAESFASLMNMLNPTAIANPSDYTQEDIRGMCVRRFKKDIKDQVSSSFKERSLSFARTQAGAAEEAAYEQFAALKFKRLDQRKGGNHLFKTTLEKALFSSPAACIQTAQNRIRNLERALETEGESDKLAAIQHDIDMLSDLVVSLQQITPDCFGKYRHLLEVIINKKTGFGWTKKDPTDRLVIFTERIETLHFLKENLLRDLKPALQEKNIAILHGSMSDVEQQAVVEDFGNADTPLRILIASDVASEGINLHYQSHRMIHFDLPWSLMVFQQRNGRIDRYGQEREPQIVYLITDSNNPKIKGDTRILELLAHKDDMASKNIGDPSALMGVYDIDLEEEKTAAAIEAGMSAEEFEKTVLKDEDAADIDMLALLMGDESSDAGEDSDEVTAELPSLFPDDYTYSKEALEFIKSRQPLQVSCDDQAQHINLHTPTELRQRLKKYLNENDSSKDRYAFMPKDGEFVLSANVADIKREIVNARKEENAWPQVHLLWAMHPVVDWLNDKAQAAFARHEAPVLTLPTLAANEVVFVLSGMIPNRKSHPVVYRWFGVQFTDGEYSQISEMDELLRQTRLGRDKFPNAGDGFDLERLQNLLPVAIREARDWAKDYRQEYIAEKAPQIAEHRARLAELKQRRISVAQERYLPGMEEVRTASAKQARFEQEQREIDTIFSDYQKWVEDTMTTEDVPYIRVVAVLQGKS